MVEGGQNTNALTAMDKLQTLLNTIYQGLGRTQPTNTFTTQQLQDMGVV